MDCRPQAATDSAELNTCSRCFVVLYSYGLRKGVVSVKSLILLGLTFQICYTEPEPCLMQGKVLPTTEESSVFYKYLVNYGIFPFLKKGFIYLNKKGRFYREKKERHTHREIYLLIYHPNDSNSQS